MTDKPISKYLDANPSDMSGEVQAMLQQDRALYDQQKALRKAIAAKLNSEMQFPPGEHCTGIAFTRWGQLQIVIAPIDAKAKSKAKPRATLSDYLAQCEANGSAH